MSQTTVRNLRKANQDDFASAIADRRAAANRASLKSIIAMLLTVSLIVISGGALKSVYSHSKGHSVANSR